MNLQFLEVFSNEKFDEIRNLYLHNVFSDLDRISMSPSFFIA